MLSFHTLIIMLMQSINTLSIVRLSIVMLSAAMQIFIMPNIVMLSIAIQNINTVNIVMLCAALQIFHYAEYCFAKCCYAEFIMLSVVYRLSLC
jgi:hypothetical protein